MQASIKRRPEAFRLAFGAGLILLLLHAHVHLHPVVDSNDINPLGPLQELQDGQCKPQKERDMP
jgi:hypothetical protein